MPDRIYIVSDGNKDRLVETYSPAQAVAHVSQGKFQVRTASQADLVRLLPGTVIEQPPRKEAVQEIQPQETVQSVGPLNAPEPSRNTGNAL